MVRPMAGYGSVDLVGRVLAFGVRLPDLLIERSAMTFPRSGGRGSVVLEEHSFAGDPAEAVVREVPMRGVGTAAGGETL